jgi:hypothetical protein
VEREGKVMVEELVGKVREVTLRELQGVEIYVSLDWGRELLRQVDGLRSGRDGAPGILHSV